MAQEVKKAPKAKKTKPAKPGNAIKFLSVGKYFLVLVILFGQGVLAYAIVDKYYPYFFEKMNTPSPDDYGVYEMEELVVNPANTNGKRYLLVEITFEIDDIGHIPMIEKNEMKLKQEIIEALSTRTVSELIKVQGREEMRSELIDIINSTVGIRTVRNLYFTKYVMQ